MRPSSVPPAASKCTSGAIWAASSQTPVASEAEWETMTKETRTLMPRRPRQLRARRRAG